MQNFEHPKTKGGPTMDSIDVSLFGGIDGGEEQPSESQLADTQDATISTDSSLSILNNEQTRRKLRRTHKKRF